MTDDLKKSFNEILYERTTSPFYGTFIISWLIWNWKIIYLSIFVSESKIDKNKIDYIIANYFDIENIVLYPLLSTIALITIMPFLTNAAYWLSLKFNKWRIDQKNIIDKKQLLSLEQSISIREEITKQEERYVKLVENKNNEIEQLRLEISELKERNQYKEKDKDISNIEDVDLYKLAERIKSSKSELGQYEKMQMLMQEDYQLTGRSDITSKFLTLLEVYGIIINKGGGIYQFTSLGRVFQKIMLDE